MILTVLFWVVAVVLVLTIAMRIPGLEVFLRPIIGSMAKIMEFVVTSLSSWALWIVITIVRAHRDLIQHLTHKEDYFDLRLRVERHNRDT